VYHSITLIIATFLHLCCLHYSTLRRLSRDLV